MSLKYEPASDLPMIHTCTETKRGCGSYPSAPVRTERKKRTAALTTPDRSARTSPCMDLYREVSPLLPHPYLHETTDRILSGLAAYILLVDVTV